MKTRIVSMLLAVIMTVSMTACSKKAESTPDMPDPNDKVTGAAPAANDTGLPWAYLIPINSLLSEWGVRKGSLSDPLIGTRILMYEKTKDEVGYLMTDLDGNGVEELVTAPFDEFTTNGKVYDILTIKDGEAFHLANSLEATYHLMADGTLILRSPKEGGGFTFKKVTINGDERPIEVEISKEESAKCYISTLTLTPFSDLEK